ncbi:MAG TPA: HAMP domain-containing protein [bacterium]|nr:HAMP domain-containing protein [bacterium]
MEIKKAFSPKLFLIIWAITLIPLLIVFLYLLRLELQVNDSQLSGHLMNFALLFLLSLALAFFGAQLISKSLFERFSKYNDIARKIAGGKFELRLPVDSEDELGKLAKFFNMLTKEHHEIQKKGVGEKLFEREKIQAILKNIGDGVIVTDIDDRIELLNSVAEAWFKPSPDQRTKLRIDQLIPDEKLLALIKKVKAGQNQIDEKVEILLKSAELQKEIVLQAVATRVVSENKKLLGVAVAFRDLTREKEIDQKKTEVVSMVSHELRSPLTSIAGFSELLLDKGISKEQARDYADIILKESRRLNDLINKYLNISRIESGKSEVQKTMLNLEDVIRSVVGMNGYLADSKHIRVQLNIPENLSDIYADRQMLGEAILNLFSNAIKYSPPHTTIKMQVEDSETAQIIRISDQGYGIPEKALEKIFDKFYRVTENEKVQEEEGSGLGLSLVREIINRHNGKIWAESKLNQGTTFFVVMPKTEQQEYSQLLMDDAIIT